MMNFCMPVLKLINISSFLPLLGQDFSQSTGIDFLNAHLLGPGLATNLYFGELNVSYPAKLQDFSAFLKPLIVGVVDCFF